MAKSFDNAVFDAACNKIATGIHVVVCSSQPANYAAIAAVTLATVTVTAGSGNGAWTVQNGAVSGRRATLAAQNGVSVTASATATYVVVDDGSLLLAATTCTSQALTSGNTVNIPTISFEFLVPT